MAGALVLVDRRDTILNLSTRCYWRRKSTLSGSHETGSTLAFSSVGYGGGEERWWVWLEWKEIDEQPVRMAMLPHRGAATEDTVREIAESIGEKLALPVVRRGPPLAAEL